jgi:hypothetical protein
LLIDESSHAHLLDLFKVTRPRAKRQPRQNLCDSLVISHSRGRRGLAWILLTLGGDKQKGRLTKQ